MKAPVRQFLSAVALVAGLSTASMSHAASVTIAPGSSPGGGYLPLSAFGIAALTFGSSDGFVSFNTNSFNFGGQSWSTLQIGADGLVVLGDTAPSGSWSAANVSLPGGPNAAVLAPFWTDLDPTAGGGIRAGVLTDGVNSWVVVDWQDVPLENGGGISSFQVWLGAGQDDVTFAYGNLANPALLTIGAQDATGTVGTNYVFNGSGVRPVNGTQLRVTSAGLPISTAVPEPGTWAMMIVGFGLVGSMVRSVRRRGLGGQPVAGQA